MRRILLAVCSTLLFFILVSGCGPISYVLVNPNTATLQPGQTLQLEAYAYDQTGAIKPGLSASWKTSDPTIATVDANGLLHAIAPGYATITAVVSRYPGTMTVIVSEAAPEAPETTTQAPSETPSEAPPPPPAEIKGVSRAVSKVEISQKSLTLPVGQTQKLEATALDAAGRTVEGTEFIWSVRDPEIATISVNGIVKAVAPGRTEVTVREDGKTDTISVKVTGEAQAQAPVVTPPAPAPTPSPTPSPTPGPTPKPTAPAPSQAQPAATKWTYVSGPAANRLKPIIDQRCATCHRPGGAMPGIALTSYEAVKKTVDNGSFVRSLQGSMAHYAGQYRDEMIDWAKGGAPR